MEMMNIDNEVGKQLDTENYSDFSSVKIRLNFMKKVYSILTVQLLITLGMGFISVNTAFGDFQMQSPGLFITTSVFAVIISLGMVCCCRPLLRIVPINYILLFAFTLCEAYIISGVCKVSSLKGQTDLVLTALTLTAGMTFALTVYAMTTKSDITTWGLTLFALSMGLVFISFLALFTSLQWVHIIISVLTIVCYAIYLVYDTQLIMGRKRFQLEIDDYILAALQLYVDIIVLFMEILKLLSAER